MPKREYAWFAQDTGTQEGALVSRLNRPSGVGARLGRVAVTAVVALLFALGSRQGWQLSFPPGLRGNTLLVT